MKLHSASTACAALLLGSLVFAADPTPQRTKLESDFCEYWTVKDEIFFVAKRSATQRVVLTGTNIRIECDQLEITAVAPEKSDKGEKGPPLPSPDKFKYLLATGNVHIVQGEREARAGRAEVFPGRDLIELTQNPVVIDHGSDRIANGVVDHSGDYVVDGARIEMLRGERRVRVYQSKIEAPSLQDLGFDKNQPAPKAANEAPAAPPAAPITLPGLPPLAPKK